MFIASGRQVIVPNAALHCNGRITDIAVSMERVSPPGSNIPQFEVWLPTLLNSSNYTIIGEVQLPAGNRIGSSSTGYFYASISLNSSSQIEFQSEDVIGYYQPSNARYLIWSVQTSGYTSYINTVTTLLTSVDINNLDTIETNNQPLIEITFGKLKIYMCSYIHT